ncbi:hypothetical protein HQ535_15735 [bacterium]|nr:hypothetical protein [bacterium]
MLGRDPPSELVGSGDSEDDASGVANPGDGGVFCPDSGREDLRSEADVDTLHVDEFLDSHRDAVEWSSRVTLGDLLGYLDGFTSCRIDQYLTEGSDLRIELGDTRDEIVDDFPG